MPIAQILISFFSFLQNYKIEIVSQYIDIMKASTLCSVLFKYALLISIPLIFGLILRGLSAWDLHDKEMNAYRDCCKEDECKVSGYCADALQIIANRFDTYIEPIIFRCRKVYMYRTGTYETLCPWHLIVNNHVEEAKKLYGIKDPLPPNHAPNF